MDADVWDSFKLTPEMQQEIDEVLKDSTLALERRNEAAAYYPGTLFLQQHGGAATDRRKVIAADLGRDYLTLISTVSIENRDSVLLVYRHPDGITDQREGRLRNSHPGSRAGDRNNNGCVRYISDFVPAP